MQNTLVSCVTCTKKEGGYRGTKHIVIMCDQHKQRGSLCTARALRATFGLCSPRRAPKHTPWKRP